MNCDRWCGLYAERTVVSALVIFTMPLINEWIALESKWERTNDENFQVYDLRQQICRCAQQDTVMTNTIRRQYVSLCSRVHSPKK